MSFALITRTFWAEVYVKHIGTSHLRKTGMKTNVFLNHGGGVSCVDF